MATQKNILFSSLHTTYASQKGIDTTRAAKLNRSFVRANFDTLVKVWPELKSSGKNNKDGNRYPATVPANVAKAILTRNVNMIAPTRVRKMQPPKEATVEA